MVFEIMLRDATGTVHQFYIGGGGTIKTSVSAARNFKKKHA